VNNFPVPLWLVFVVIAFLAGMTADQMVWDAHRDKLIKQFNEDFAVVHQYRMNMERRQ